MGAHKIQHMATVERENEDTGEVDKIEILCKGTFYPALHSSDPLDPPEPDNFEIEEVIGPDGKSFEITEDEDEAINEEVCNG